MANAVLLSGYAAPVVRARAVRRAARRRGRPAAELLGASVGELQVVAPAPRIAGRTAWVCLCRCGQPKIVRTAHLTTGQIRSCGCQAGRRVPPWWVLQ